jgi:small subunit ribosomal protein S13
MARIEGVDLPRNKRIEIALTYIFGIGRSAATKVLTEAEIDGGTRTQDLTESEIARLRDVLQRGYTVEGDLRKEVAMNIKRLIDLNTYRGIRHKRGLPVRGQRTSTNARTRKGPRRMAVKRKVK